MNRFFSFVFSINCLLVTVYSKAQIITTIAGDSIGGYSGDMGQATAAELNYPTGITFDAAGNIYIADFSNNRIRKIDTSGIITTIAGNGTTGSSGDGGQATAAQLNGPSSLVFDSFGNLFISEQNSHRIRKINSSGIINTIAGTGVSGFSGDGGQASIAELDYPEEITFDASGNLYIADWGNNRIRKINTTGVITTIAGTGVGGFSGDGGQATAGELNGPYGLAFDTSNNYLYVSEYYSNRIRKVNASGIITTIAGNGINGSSGDGGQATAAELNRPLGIAVNGTGDLYIADGSNHQIRSITTSGIITTVAGNGILGFSGDGGQAIAAELNTPHDIAFDAMGNSYIADTQNNRVRKTTNTTGIEALSLHNEQLNVWPNPVSTIINLELKIKNGVQNTTLSITDVLGNTVKESRIKSQETRVEINLADLQNGIYFVNLKTNEGAVTKKIVVQH